MQLKEATAQDAALISRIIASSWRDAYRDFIDPAYLSRLPDTYWLPSIRTWLDSGRMYGLIAEKNGEPVGCVVYGRGRDEQYGHWGEIVSLYVLPHAMKQGVGTALLDAAVSALQEDGYADIYLWAIAEKWQTLQFYQRRGFRVVGEPVRYTLGSSEVTDVRLAREG